MAIHNLKYVTEALVLHRGEKLKIVCYAEAHGNRSAGREFSISESNIRQWRKMKERLLKMRKSKRAERGTIAKFPEIECKMLESLTKEELRAYPF